MRAGRFRHRLIIEADEGGQAHAMGGQSHQWVEFLPVRATAAYKGGKEFERARQKTADISTLFIIRYDSRIDTKELHSMRLRSLDDGSIYLIKFADDVEHRRKSIHIHASESQHQ